MKKIILFSVLSFFLGAITTLVSINSLEPSSNPKPITNSVFDLPNSIWVDKTGKFKLEFPENDNSCYLIINSKGKDMIAPFTYSKIRKKIILTPKEDFNSMMTLAFMFGQFQSITATLENTSITLPVKEGNSITFKRQ